MAHYVRTRKGAGIEVSTVGDDWSTVSREYGNEVVDDRFDRTQWPDRLAASSRTMRKGIYVFIVVVIALSVVIAARHHHDNPLVTRVNAAEQTWSPNTAVFCRERHHIAALALFSARGLNASLVRDDLADFTVLESASEGHVELEQVHSVLVDLVQMVADPSSITSRVATQGFYSSHLEYHDGLGYSYLNAARDLTGGIAWVSGCHSS